MYLLCSLSINRSLCQITKLELEDCLKNVCIKLLKKKMDQMHHPVDKALCAVGS